MYATTNPTTKKALLRALAEGVKIRAFNPSGMFPDPVSCSVTLEGPHYPKPHRWYATAKVDDAGFIIPGTVK